MFVSVSCSRLTERALGAALLCCFVGGTAALQIHSARVSEGVSAQIPTKEIAPGVHMPVVMLGEGGLLAGEAPWIKHQRASAMTEKWLSIGGRGLDTAQVYGTEPATGQALRASGLKRKDAFILTKLHPSTTTKSFLWNGEITNSVLSSIAALGTTYVDLMLIHSPGPSDARVWRELEALYDQKKLRALGVSNFNVQQLEALMRSTRVPIAVNQRKMNVRNKDTEVLRFCEKHHITYEAWAPLGEGRDLVLKEPLLKEIAANHHKSAAQVALKWVLQKGATLTMQSENLEHLRANIDLFDWQLSSDEEGKLDALSDMKPLDWEQR